MPRHLKKNVLGFGLRSIGLVHNWFHVWRDVKPENFVLGLKDGPAFNMIHMIDFGLAIQYIDINGKLTSAPIGVWNCNFLSF